MNRRRAKRVFASDDAGVIAVTDQGVFELAAAVEDPAFQPGFGQSQVARVVALRPGKRAVLRIGLEDPIALEAEDRGEKQQQADAQALQPAVGRRRAEFFEVVGERVLLSGWGVAVPPRCPTEQQGDEQSENDEDNRQETWNPHSG